MRVSNLNQALGIIRINQRIVKQSIRDDGTGWVTLSCPFAKTNHKNGIDKNPSFGISVDPNGQSHYNCLSCGEKGKLSMLPHKLMSKGLKQYTSLIEVVAALKELEVEDSLTLTSKVRGLKPFEPDPYELYLTSNPMESIDESKQARAYLKERDIPLSVATHMDLGYNSEDYRISFPIKWLDGKILGYSQRLALTKSQIETVKRKRPGYLDRLPKIKNTEDMNKDFCLMGLEHYKVGSKCLIVEGLFGLARMNTLLFNQKHNLTPLAALGSSLKDNQVDLLASLFRRVFIAFDNDNSGRVGAYKLQQALKNRGVIVSVLDWGKTDKDDIDNFCLTDLIKCGIIKETVKTDIVKNRLV